MIQRIFLGSFLLIAMCGCAHRSTRAPIAATRATPVDVAYSIRLEHPARVGDRGRIEIVVAEVTTDQTRWSGYPDPVTNTYSRGVRLVGDVEITGTDEKGNVTGISCVVDSCSKYAGEDGTEEETLLEHGDRLVAREKRNATAFTVNGKEPEPTTESFLTMMFRLEAKARQVSQDDVFGTSEKKHVGDTWPIHGAAMAKHYALYDAQLAPSDAVGNVKLVGVELVHGEPCLRVEADVDLKKYSPTTRSTRGAYSNASTRGHSTWWVPLNSDSVVEQHLTSYERHYKLQGITQRRRYSTDRIEQTESATRVYPTTAPTALPSASTQTVQSAAQ